MTEKGKKSKATPVKEWPGLLIKVFQEGETFG